MAKPRELRRRIRSIQNTRKITKTMELVSTAKRPVASQSSEMGDKPAAAHAAELVAPLMAQFQTGTLDAVEVVFAQFRSAVSTPPTTLRVLPIEGGKVRTVQHSTFYILKPSA